MNHPIKRCIVVAILIDMFVHKVGHTDAPDLCEVHKDRVNDSSEERRAVDKARNILENFFIYLEQHRVCYVEEVFSDIMSEISKNQADIH